MLGLMRIASLAAMAMILTACESLPPVPSATKSGPRVLVLDGKNVSATDVGGFTSWICVKYSYDADESSPVLIEVGYFGQSQSDGNGFVLDEGGFTGKFATYSHDGLERRWDWGPDKDGNLRYAILIKSDGTALYYNFSNVSIGQTTKASDVFKSFQRKSPAVSLSSN